MFSVLFCIQKSTDFTTTTATATAAAVVQHTHCTYNDRICMYFSHIDYFCLRKGIPERTTSTWVRRVLLQQKRITYEIIANNYFQIELHPITNEIKWNAISFQHFGLGCVKKFVYDKNLFKLKAVTQIHHFWKHTQRKT